MPESISSTGCGKKMFFFLITFMLKLKNDLVVENKNEVLFRLRIWNRNDNADNSR